MRALGARATISPRGSQSQDPRTHDGRTMSAKQAQHEAAEALFGAIIALLDKHEHAHTLTEAVVEELARAYAAVSTSVPEQERLGP